MFGRMTLGGFGHLGSNASGGGGGPVLFPLGTIWGIIGHSYEAFAVQGGTTATSFPLIKTNPRAPMPTLFALNPQYLHENWWAFDTDAGIPYTALTANVSVGDTCTIGGFSVTVSAISQQGSFPTKTGTLSLSGVTGSIPTGTATFSSAGSPTATLQTANFKKYTLGDLSAISGDMIDANAGYAGGYVRLPAMMARKPQFLTVDIAVNSLNNGVTPTNCVTQYMNYYNYVRAHPNGANTIIFFCNCNPIATTSGFDTLTFRQNIANFNTQLLTAIQALPDYNTKVFYIDIFEALIESPTNLAADLLLFVNSPNAKGLKYLDNLKAYDTLHPSNYGSYLIGKLQSDIANPLTTSGSYFATTFLGGANSIVSPSSVGAGTAGGKSSNVSGTVITGLTINGYSSTGTSYYNTYIEFTPLTGTFTAGETVTAPTGSATGTIVTSGIAPGRMAVNSSSTYTVGDIITGSTSGATGTITKAHKVSIVASKVAGTGPISGGGNGIPVGSSGQLVTFNEGGFTNTEKIQIVFNTVTAGLGVTGATGWCAAFDKVNVDAGYAMISNIRSFITKDATNVLAESMLNDTAESIITGTIATTTLTVTVTSGVIRVGGLLQGNNIPAGTYITQQLTGTAGSTGTYQINNSLTIAVAQSMLIGCAGQHLGAAGDYELVTQHAFMPGVQTVGIKHNVEIYTTPGATGTCNFLLYFGAGQNPWIGIVNDPTIPR